MNNTLSHEEREALKQEIFHSLHCALPGNVVSFDPETQTASIQPAVKLGSLPYPILTDVPVLRAEFAAEAFTVGWFCVCGVSGGRVSREQRITSGFPGYHLPQYAIASAWNCRPSGPPTWAKLVWMDFRAGYFPFFMYFVPFNISHFFPPNYAPTWGNFRIILTGFCSRNPAIHEKCYPR